MLIQFGVERRRGADAGSRIVYNDGQVGMVQPLHSLNTLVVTWTTV